MKNEGVKKMNIKVSNLDNEARAYDITANVWVNADGNIENIEDGVVIKDGMNIATFARYSNNSHRTFIGLSIEEEDVVGAEIKAFIEGASILVSSIDMIGVN